MYLAYHEETKDAAQQRIWTFYEAVKIEKERGNRGLKNKARFQESGLYLCDFLFSEKRKRINYFRD